MQLGKVRWAAERGGGSLRPRLIVAILAAYHKLLHPLRAAATSRPQLLLELDHLASMRDESGHAVEEGAGPASLDLVIQQTDLAYITIALLANDPVVRITPAASGSAKGVA